MYKTIGAQGYRNLGEYRIKINDRHNIKVGDSVTIVRMRVSLQDGTSDYSMDTDCEVKEIVSEGTNIKLTLDNHKPEKNLIYYLMDKDTVMSVSKTHRYYQYLIPGELNPFKYLNKRLFKVMLHAKYVIQGIRTDTWHEVSVFADNEDEVLDILKSNADIEYSFDYGKFNPYIREIAMPDQSKEL